MVTCKATKFAVTCTQPLLVGPTDLIETLPADCHVVISEQTILSTAPCAGLVTTSKITHLGSAPIAVYFFTVHIYDMNTQLST